MSKKIPISHPGVLVRREFVEPYGLSASELARLMDVDRNLVSQLLRGKRNITASTAFRLSIVFGTTAQFWMNLQQHYDLEIEKEHSFKTMQKRVTPLSTVVV